jgi:hypothetical protein
VSYDDFFRISAVLYGVGIFVFLTRETTSLPLATAGTLAVAALAGGLAALVAG